MRRYDVHAHAVMIGTNEVSQVEVRQLIKREGFAGPVPGTGWSMQAALEFMDERGIALQLLSSPQPLDTSRAAAWNEQTADLVRQVPSRFGLLATLPMDDPDAALSELTRAADDLGADGVGICTNYNGAYLGNPRFLPVFHELERRNLAVFIHPTLPPNFELVGCGRPGPLLEYPVETARSVVDVLFAGLLLDLPDLHLVLAHAGGVLTALVERITLLGAQPWTANPRGLSSEQLRAQASALYLDTAITGGPGGIRPAANLVGVDQIVFGTDYPPAGVDTIEATLAGLEATLTEHERVRVEATFVRLFPRAAARAASDHDLGR